jgi:hypothetical protein
VFLLLQQLLLFFSLTLPLRGGDAIRCVARDSLRQCGCAGRGDGCSRVRCLHTLDH